MAARLLIADDNKDMANSLARLLRHEGFETQVAFDGEQAVERAVEFNPDVLILDIDMPVLDGLQAAHRLRGMPQFSGKTFVALTGFSDQRHLDLASQAEFDEYLIKPFKIDTLMTILTEAASHVRHA